MSVSDTIINFVTSPISVCFMNPQCSSFPEHTALTRANTPTVHHGFIIRPEAIHLLRAARFFISDKRHPSSCVGKWLSVNWTTWGLNCETGWQQQSFLSFSHSEPLFQSPFVVRKCSFPSCSATRHALPLALALAIRSDTVLMGTPLRDTLTWMKSVAGDRLQPSAFSKWTCRYPEKKDYAHYKQHATVMTLLEHVQSRSLWSPVRRLVKGTVNCPTKSFLAVWSWSSTTNRTRARSGTCSWKLRVQFHCGLKPVEGAREL